MSWHGLWKTTCRSCARGWTSHLARHVGVGAGCRSYSQHPPTAAQSSGSQSYRRKPLWSVRQRPFSSRPWSPLNPSQPTSNNSSHLCQPFSIQPHTTTHLSRQHTAIPAVPASLLIICSAFAPQTTCPLTRLPPTCCKSQTPNTALLSVDLELAAMTFVLNGNATYHRPSRPPAMSAHVYCVHHPKLRMSLT